MRIGPAQNARYKTPSIVMVHGLIVSSLYLVPTAKLLSSLYPVYCPDLPGFGLSENPPEVLDIPQLADNLVDCLDMLGLHQPVMVGNSLGCQIIADLAARYPDRIASAVLVGPTMDPKARNGLAQIGRWLWDWPGERASLALVQLLNFYEAGVKRSYKTFRYALEDRIEDKLPKINVPTLVIRGSKDPVAPQEWCKKVVQLLPQGKLAVIAGGPHVANYTSPEQLSRMILNFIQRTHEEKK